MTQKHDDFVTLFQCYEKEIEFFAFSFYILHDFRVRFFRSSIWKVCDFYNWKPKGKLYYITEFSRFLNFPFL